MNKYDFVSCKKVLEFTTEREYIGLCWDILNEKNKQKQTPLMKIERKLNN